MTLKFWTRSFLVAALFGAAMPVFAAEITTPAKQAHVTDFASGKVLFSKDADAPMKPASMAKIMTVFVAFQRIADGQLRMDDKFTFQKRLGKKVGREHFSKLAERYRFANSCTALSSSREMMLPLFWPRGFLVRKTPLPKK